jgi:hypothetical protein
MVFGDGRRDRAHVDDQGATSAGGSNALLEEHLSHDGDMLQHEECGVGVAHGVGRGRSQFRTRRDQGGGFAGCSVPKVPCRIRKAKPWWNIDDSNRAMSKSQGPRRSARVIDRHASARQPAPATHRLDDLADRVDHELRLLLVYLVAAVGVRDVLRVRHELGELLLCLFLRGIGDVESLAKWGKGI